MDEKDQKITDLLNQLDRAHGALIVLEYYNRIHNDFEAYLLQVAEWGLGDRENIPKPDSFVSGLEPTEKLISKIRNARK